MNLLDSHLWEPVTRTEIPPFFVFFMAAGAAVTFYIIFATDWLPLKFNMESPREKAFAIILLAFSLVALVYLLWVQLFRGGVMDRWFPFP